MQFKDGARVFASDGKEVGRIDRVVIDPRSKQLTHVIVRKGWLFTEDKVVPVSWFAESNEDRAILAETKEDLQKLPEFETSYFVPTGDPDIPAGYAPSLYWYPPMAAYGTPLPVPAVDIDKVEVKDRNIPDNTVALKEGARVISTDNKHVGNVERIVTDSSANPRVTHIVISKGLLKEMVSVPISWVDQIGEKEIHLAVSTQVLNRLTTHEHSM